MEEIDLKEIFYEIKKNIALIIVIIILGGILGFIYQNFIVTPMYKSTTSLVLAKSSNVDSEENSSDSITQSEITLNQKLVATYGEIIKSRSVASVVIDKLNLDITEEEFMKNIEVEAKEDTELLEITVENEDPQISCKIANSLAEVFSNKVEEVYNIKNVSIIDTAQVAKEPYNINLLKTLLIFVVCSAVIAFAYIFIKFYFNDTINSEEDIEKLLELPILAVIPEYKEK